jgi:hypothetical protein
LLYLLTVLPGLVLIAEIARRVANLLPYRPADRPVVMGSHVDGSPRLSCSRRAG